MKNKIYLSLIIASLFAGCSSSDIQEYIEDEIINKIKNDTGVLDDSGAINESVEADFTVTGEIEDALEAHNSARNAVGVTSKLTWDETIAEDAQSYADEMAASGRWDHDPKNQKTDGTGYVNGVYGENLYTSTAKPTLKVAIDAWVDEEQYYTYGNIGDDATCESGQMCGHYTQVIWKDTSKVGCAMSKYLKDSGLSSGPDKNWYIVVCKYQTAGNVSGQKPY